MSCEPALSTTSIVRSLADGLEPLRAWFESNAGRTRLVAIQSAT